MFYRIIMKTRRRLRHWFNLASRTLHKKLKLKRRAPHLRLGDSGEDLAAKALEEIGVEVICRKMRNRYGEIDIIARENGVLCFIEVKTRTNPRLSRPADAVDIHRQRRYARAAALYRRQINCDCPPPYRFDIMEVIYNNHAPVEMNYIRQAFREPQSGHRSRSATR